MCGIIGAISQKNIVPFLLEGLKRLEYRGYDSVGIAVLNKNKGFQLAKIAGKVSALEKTLKKNPIQGLTGLGHTRWATHGKPTKENAHPHIVNERVILVHNGIIENYEEIKYLLKNKHYSFLSETDSELIAWIIYDNLTNGMDFISAVHHCRNMLKGSYAFCVMDTKIPDRIIGARSGPPLMLGIGIEENLLSSDILALQDAAKEFIYLEDGDLVEISSNTYQLYDKFLKPIQRKIYQQISNQYVAEKEGFPHFMLKEIFEQPQAISNTLKACLTQDLNLDHMFGKNAESIFKKTKRVQIVGCGTSYHAGLVARLWIEELAGIPCHVEISSEFHFRKRAKEDGHTLLVGISQSGETADTLGALRSVEPNEFLGPLVICNVEHSSMLREAKLVFITRAGPEIGVCSTKSFTTQLSGLFLLAIMLGSHHALSGTQQKELITQLEEVPEILKKTLLSADKIRHLAPLFNHRKNALFIGRELLCALAEEGALKLKEISYIHAEAYPAGELKHGALALIEPSMITVVLAPNNFLFNKIKSNIQEVNAREGQLIIVTEASTHFSETDSISVIELPSSHRLLEPFVYAIFLQLLSYYVAVLQGKDVDQPRNLAKSVTVE